MAEERYEWKILKKIPSKSIVGFSSCKQVSNDHVVSKGHADWLKLSTYIVDI